MKKLKVAAFCIALLTIPVLLESCLGCDTGDWPTAFSIKSLSVRTINRNGAALDSPSPGPLPNFAFSVDIEAEYRQAYIQPRSTMAAFACDPVVPLGDQKVATIGIISNNTLTTPDGHYDAGLDLGQLFILQASYLQATAIEGIIGHDLYADSFYLFSDETVDVAQTHRFTITISLDDGRTFTLVTAPAELTPN